MDPFANMQPGIAVHDLCKVYKDQPGNDFRAVDSVEFSIYPGEIFGLLGPNGAGKTTTLRILSTVLRPSGGTALVAGFDTVLQPEEVRRRIGFMSANTSVYDRMTPCEMMEHFGTLYGMDKETLNKRIDYLLDRLDMRGFSGTFGEKMSTGMKQKVSIARTLVHDPSVLIFDEPTNGLDVFVARSLLQTIRDLKEQRKCIIFSTHIMSEVEKLCDRVAIMHKGRILTEGTLPQLYEKHKQNDLEEIFFQLIAGE